MDIIIPLGNGSRWNNGELKYCLRSIEKYLYGFDHIFIIGDCPAWVQNVIHIPATDIIAAGVRDLNIHRKIMFACDDRRVSDEMFFMNDDHFFLRQVDVEYFPHYYDGTLEQRVGELTEKHPYKKTLLNTIQFLNLNVCDHKHFDVHCPMVLDKNVYQSAMPTKFPIHGYGLKSLYANLTQVEGTPMEDIKIGEPYPMHTLEQIMAGREWFSIGNKCLRSGGMPEYLQSLYPSPSKYEM